MIKFRPYQDRCIESIFEYYARGNSGNPVVAAPTGTGKSVMIAGFVQRAFARYGRQKILVVTHVKELVAQNHQKLQLLWDQPGSIGINAQSLKRREYNRDVIFCNIKSIAANPHWFGKVDLMLIDEAHLVNPTAMGQYNQVIKALKELNPWFKVIGFTATPWRLGHGHICEDGVFTDLVIDLTTRDEYNKLIEDCYLSKLISRPTDITYDLSKLHIRGGEFIESEVIAAMDNDELTYQALEYALPYFEGRRTGLVFCSGIRHAISARNMLNYFGIKTEVVHSKVSDSHRDNVISALGSGDMRMATNSNILTTGVDIPTIDFIIDLKPTNSATLRNQMYGRGTRCVYADGFDLDTLIGRQNAIHFGGKPNCLVLDFVGNTERLGPINDPVTPKKKGKSTGDVPIKICPKCGCYNHTRSVLCDNCGYEFPVTRHIKKEASTEELVVGVQEQELPKFEELVVTHRTCRMGYTKKTQDPYIQITYYCNGKMFSEFQSFERQKSQLWWNENVRDEFRNLGAPTTCEQASLRFEQLKMPSHIIAYVNKKPHPAVSKLLYKVAQEPVKINQVAANTYDEDDIPF